MNFPLHFNNCTATVMKRRQSLKPNGVTLPAMTRIESNAGSGTARGAFWHHGLEKVGEARRSWEQ